MKLGYADPPYPGQAKKHYADHKDYRGEVSHEDLIADLKENYDGFVLHTSVPSLGKMLRLIPEARVGAWVKPFAAFKKNVPVSYAWEPVLVVAARKPVVHRTIRPLRDFLSESITMGRGLAGVKPEKVVWWCLEMLGAETADELVDIFPGTGAVQDAWEAWKTEVLRLTPRRIVLNQSRSSSCV
jgi:hypothetical protein